MKEFIKRWNWDTHKTRFLPPLREFILGNENYNEQWDMSNKIHSSEQTKHKIKFIIFSIGKRYSGGQNGHFVYFQRSVSSTSLKIIKQ